MTQTPPNANRLPVLVNLSTLERFLLDGPSVTVGRGPSNMLILDSDEFVSNQHARIYWAEGGWWIEDLNSSNGTSVDDQIVSAPRKLAPGNVIKVGRTKFRIE
ncbi:MAG: FHA domain-containing protein [Candidatus Obscuribacterales bacterium]|nr:FHA domain-containing protein [Candidatus Obscuribacterales bacterium]